MRELPPGGAPEEGGGVPDELLGVREGACKDCYPTDLSMGKNWKYLCTCCMDTIGNLRGFKALKPDVDLLKVKTKRK